MLTDGILKTARRVDDVERAVGIEGNVAQMSSST